MGRGWLSRTYAACCISVYCNIRQTAQQSTMQSRNTETRAHRADAVCADSRGCAVHTAEPEVRHLCWGR